MPHATRSVGSQHVVLMAMRRVMACSKERMRFLPAHHRRAIGKAGVLTHIRIGNAAADSPKAAEASAQLSPARVSNWRRYAVLALLS